MIPFPNPLPLASEPARAVQRVLTPGETVLWSARPSRRRLLQRGGIDFACGLFFLIVSLAYLGISINHAAGWPALLIDAPFLVAGLWLTIRAWRKAGVAAQAVYLITSRRVMTVNADGSAQSLSPAEAQGRTVKRRADGFGDLYFAAWDKRVETSDGSSLQRNGFLGIPDVKSVDELIGQTFSAAPSPQ